MIKHLAIVPFLAWAVAAHAAPKGYFDLRPGVTLESGETWKDQNGKRYRLYGVQSCLRGTAYTNATGKKQDCGDASMAVFAAYIADTAPVCAPTATAPEITYVICFSSVAGKQLDLGTILITSGFAFASLNAQGLPYYPPYSVAEQQARKDHAGLWQYSDVTHPSIILSKLAAEREGVKK